MRVRPRLSPQGMVCTSPVRCGTIWRTPFIGRRPSAARGSGAGSSVLRRGGAMTQRVGVTGIGLVTPLGNDTATTWQALREGRSGVACISSFDVSRHEVRIAAEVKDFDPSAYMDRKEVRRTERFIHLGFAAAKQAVGDACLDVAAMPDDVGVIVGSGAGGLHVLEEQFQGLFDNGADPLSPFLITP